MKKKTKRQISPEEELLKKFKRKLTLEALLKSFIIGCVSGLMLSVPVSIISFITVYNALWIALVVFALGTAGFTALSYFRYYRTNVKKTAARVDGVGLEERVVTMLEFADRNDAIAVRQREDARRALQNVEPKHIKIPFPKLPVIVLAATAVVAICMMVASTVHVVKVNEAAAEGPAAAGETVETEEDKIIREMIEELRKIIDEANVKTEIKDKLHAMVDDLEARLYPTDSTEVKIAKISETAQEIHKILQEELSKSTIADELQKHDTTKTLGEAIESEDITKIEAAFREMYDSIAPLAGAQKYDVLEQTANDILQSIEDATVKPDDELRKALEDLARAMLDAIPPKPEDVPDKDAESDKINEDIKEAFDAALDAIKDALEHQKETEDTDQALQDAMHEAMDKLGNSDPDKEPEEEDPNDKKPDDGEEEDENGPSRPGEDGKLIYDTVLDGKTPYIDVYDDYYEWAVEMLTSGNLSDSERQMIENYLKILKGEKN